MSRNSISMRAGMKRIFSRGFMTLIMILMPHGATAQQDLLRAAAVVNDEIISTLDLAMRTRLAILVTGQVSSPGVVARTMPRVLRRLIDERLQAQEAQRLKLEVPDDQVASAVNQIAQRNKMTSEDFVKHLKVGGVLPGALVEQVRAQIIWQTLIERRLRPSVQVTDEEVDEVIGRIVANRGAMEHRVSEIFLAVDSFLQENEVRDNAERLFQEITAGADFGAVARQSSQSATAARGGDLGWVKDGQLAEELSRLLANMRPGTLSRPIRTSRGFRIIFLRDQRQISVGDVTLNLRQVLVAIPADASDEQRRAAGTRAEVLRERIDGCNDVEKLGSPGSGDLGAIKMSELPPAVRQAVADLPIGQPSRPVRTGAGLSVLLVCAREEVAIDRDPIREQLVSERLDVLIRRYMRDLYRNANVDIRI